MSADKGPKPVLAITSGEPAGIGPEIRWNPTLPWMLFVMLLATIAMFRSSTNEAFAL